MSTATAFDHHARPFLDAPIPRLSVSPPLLRKVEALRGLDVFGGAGETDLFRLAEASLLRRFERGRTIVRGSGADDCVILVSGRAKTTMPRGVACGEFALALVDAGEIVSEGCWARHAAPELGETVALEPSVALFMPRRALDALLSRNARVSFQFMEAIIAKLRRVLELAAQNSCLEVGDRLYRKLLELSATRSRPEQGGVRIEHGLFQSELAAGIGASREAVNRQLAIWRDQGLVETGRRYVLVKDPFGLSMAVSANVRGGGFTEVSRMATNSERHHYSDKASLS
jgi:CRP/FNR family transcriptional regulator, cyclic AMP receptor protein